MVSVQITRSPRAPDGAVVNNGGLKSPVAIAQKFGSSVLRCNKVQYAVTVEVADQNKASSAEICLGRIKSPIAFAQENGNFSSSSP